MLISQIVVHMKIEIVSQKKNPLMGREDIHMRINHEGQRTPSRQEILKEVARSLKSSEDRVIIDRIFTVQGQAVSDAKVLAYEKKEGVPAYKMNKMKRRMKTKAEAAQEAPAEKKAEAPAEKPAAEKAAEGKDAK
jgi:ribosomal protein S24E